jgi:hypothetical protein
MILKLQRQTSDNYSQNLVYHLRDFASVRDKKDVVVFPGIYEFIKVSEWLQFFADKAAERRPDEFLDIVEGINLAASQYSQQCVSLQNRVTNVLSEKLLDDAGLRKLRQAWGAGREHANKVLSEWTDFCEQVRRELDGDIAGVHFPVLPALD